ncbi:hypothetical protein F5B22DRAFT_618937 [Xylaria bambusicola]|uniref:uncharacterized protein n=1 Tax=Xylaria bambusicola TaxID=326684 RepID=UPI002007BA4A|nr:uncharacterized protein F5B22DRAFT_618937 [Xylaria bambusicola]KAI0508845.1 hypothetical protein F5B22DRAFT_618937 [Xylaria bambusicola]
MKLLTAGLACLSGLLCVVQASPTHQFDHFFPGWNNLVQNILRENCSEPYAEYLADNLNLTLGFQSLVNPVIDCILEEFPEFRKAELATGALVLGLIPTILQSIGSSTVETALVGLRRPVLGFLISAGSPAVSMMKTNDFARAVTEFVEGGEPTELGIESLRWSAGRATWAVLIAILEYVIVGGAVANVLHLAWELGYHAVAIFAPNTIFGVPLWTLGAALIHVAGCAALWVRIRIRTVDARSGPGYTVSTKPLNTWVPAQFLPAVFQPPIVFELRRDRSSSFWFYSLTWAISIGILAQVAFGTLVLSGLLFFSLADCLIIVGRYTVSAVACRAVVRLELAGMTAALAKPTSNEAAVPLTDWKVQPQDISD